MRKLCSIHDDRLGFYNPPFCTESEGAAKSAVRSALMQNQDLRAFAKDQSLVLLADFDDESGEIIPCSPPVVIARLSDFLLDEVAPGD